MCDYDHILSDIPGKTTLISHKINTGSASPISVPPRRTPQAYRDTTILELKAMLEAGIIEPSTSPWRFPLVFVPKKDGSLRLCVDYRQLNAKSMSDTYPMPRADDLIDRIGNANYITTLDLTKGYYQVPMDEESKEKTAFATPIGLYQFRMMPFGLKGAPATFQRLMDHVLRELDFSDAFFDDMEIRSPDWESHLSHLREVFTRLEQAHLTAKPKKCRFAMPYCFLGLAGYYRRFVPNFATVAAPLTKLTTKDSPDKVKWDQTLQGSFDSLKNILTSSPLLRNPDFEKHFYLQTDASGIGLGTVLSQGEGDDEHPVAYWSRKLLPRETRYSAVEKECLAVVEGIKAFRHYLIGRNFTVETDHRALQWLDKMKDGNPRLTRWTILLQPYDFSVRYRPGTANRNADGLSRQAWEMASPS